MTAALAHHPHIEAAARSAVSAHTVREMAELDRAGFSLLPLGVGDDGKAPAVSFRDAGALPLAAVLRQMRGSMYGIRLSDLVVVDLDTDTPEARDYVRARFGESPVQVETSRGVHHYWKAGETLPRGVRLPGIVIDVKAGPNSYVVGPESVRPDTGLIYSYRSGRLGGTALPVLVDRMPPVATGQRNDQMFRRALQFAQTHDDFGGLLAELLAQRDFDIEDPHSFPDAEIEKIARSVWSYKVEGRLWAGRNSAFRVNRMVIDRLAYTGEHDALALYLILEAEHGHLARSFKIDPVAMKRAGKWSKGKNAAYAARDVLIRSSLLKKVRGYSYELNPIVP